MATVAALVMLLFVGMPAAYACEITEPREFQIGGTDLVGLDEPDGNLAAAYARWLDEYGKAGVDPNPPNVLGVTRMEVVAETEYSDTWTRGSVFAPVGTWGEVGPAELETVEPHRRANIDECDDSGGPELGTVYFVVTTDRGVFETPGYGDEGAADLDRVFGDMEPLDVDEQSVNGEVSRMQNTGRNLRIMVLVVVLVLAAIAFRPLVITRRERRVASTSGAVST